MTTTLTPPIGRTLSGSGLNCEVSTAFGMTKTPDGSRQHRRQTFSLDVCETVMTLSAEQRTNCSSLLR